MPNRTRCGEKAAAVSTAAVTGSGEGDERPAGALAGITCLNVPAAKRKQQPFRRRRRPVSGEGGDRPTTALLSAVATMDRRGGGGRRQRLHSCSRCNEMAAALIMAAAIGERGRR